MKRLRPFAGLFPIFYRELLVIRTRMPKQLFSWLVSWYLVKRAENGNPPFDRNLFDTAAYLLETVLLILTVICLHR